jgi:protein phosphatase
MPAHVLECAFRSHVGLVRAHNEDYLVCRPDQGVLVLADGMGGHNAGEVASRIAVEKAAECLCDIQVADTMDDLESLLAVADAVERANGEVFNAVDGDPDLKGMGTTLVLALFRESHIFYAHVGDSRLYRFREGRLRALTRDHSLVQEVMDNGLFDTREEAKQAGIGDNVLTRSIGMDPSVESDVGDHELVPGDLFLLCSDGLCGRVEDSLIEALMQDAQNLEEMATCLEKAALDAGGRDNISLILARVRDEEEGAALRRN